MSALARRAAACFAASSLALAMAPTALAHPHIFAEARLDVMVDAGRTVTALRNLWRFDDLFSSTVLVEFDKNKDLKLDGAELLTIANTIYKSLAEFDYFQLVTANGKSVAIQQPKELIATFEDNQLVVLFETAPKQPLKLTGKVDFGIYDPTFYTAIDFTEDKNMSVSRKLDGCSEKVVRPDPDEAIAENQDTLTEEFFNQPGGNDMSKIFATRLEIECPQQG